MGHPWPQVIDFDSSARTSTLQCIKDRMIPATADNKGKLKRFIQGMRQGGGTSFDSAFRVADRILKDEVRGLLVFFFLFFFRGLGTVV